MSAPASQTLPEEAVEHLRKADPVLREVIELVGPITPSFEPDLWWSLVDSIVSQQLSIKAAATIVKRLEALAPGEQRPGPEQMLQFADDELRACGLSRSKLTYIRDLASKWLDGTLQPDLFADLPDEEVISELTQVKGIGRWTAEMFLIFTLGRPDVLPVDDLGLRIAVQRAYALEERPRREVLLRLGEPWRPFRSAATLYLWRSRRI